MGVTQEVFFFHVHVNLNFDCAKVVEKFLRILRAECSSVLRRP